VSRAAAALAPQERGCRARWALSCKL